MKRLVFFGLFLIPTQVMGAAKSEDMVYAITFQDSLKTPPDSPAILRKPLRRGSEPYKIKRPCPETSELKDAMTFNSAVENLIKRANRYYNQQPEPYKIKSLITSFNELVIAAQHTDVIVNFRCHIRNLEQLIAPPSQKKLTPKKIEESKKTEVEFSTLHIPESKDEIDE
jgi:hypothetical protein